MLVHAQGSNKEEEEEEGGREGGGGRKEEEEEGGREGGGGRKEEEGEAGEVSTNMTWVAYHTLCCYYKLGWNTGFKQKRFILIPMDLPVQLFPVPLTATQRQVETLFLFCMVLTTQC